MIGATSLLHEFTIDRNFRGCLDAKIASLITHNSSLITHYSPLNFSHPFGTITHFLSLNIFHTICGPIPVTRCSFFFFFYSFQYPETQTQWKKKGKKSLDHPNPGEDQTQWKKKGKKQKETQEEKTEPVKEEKEKKKKKSKGAAKLWLVGAPCMFNYKNAIELWIMETEKS